MTPYEQGRRTALVKLGLDKSKLNSHKLVEELAELEHKQWEAWAKSISNSEDISKERLARWKKSFKPYKKLTSKNKDADRVWAKKVLKAVKKAVR